MGFDFEALAEASSGAVGGLLSTTILYPLDTCKTKYQAESTAGSARKYRSLLDVLWEAVESRKILSLYQGLGTKNLQSVVSQFIYFYSYSFFKNHHLKRAGVKRMGTGTNLIVAAAAGACTALLTQPLDTAAARMQTSTFGKSKTLMQTFREGTWKELWAGIEPSLVLCSNPAIQYTVFEQLKYRLLRGGQVGVAGEPAPVVLSAFSAFLLGALSKSIATVITYPAIRSKVMIQAADTDDVKDKSKDKPIRKMHQAFSLIWNREGFFGFYKGLNAQILKTVLGAALMLMIKEKTSEATWAVLLAIREWSMQGKKRIQGVKLPPGLATPVGTLTGAALVSRAVSR
ncbi:solute carrier family 25 (peroxisomal adenine nucleotide transporter), member 17 [Marchantia polymorpha subsp. ruderalis]|uniref:Peroxisomal adenine nucleotide carrier 1 n=2 Tax=Marchantia polymorpha TaxID=3197 RepID=A0A176VF66_MARPO|nr:hypothetical protein AXG93_1923s1310 [Marchantia polymorpha subsp. ruderalis]PTQ48535.1 hypothetical protein MARPO_0005s0171 [Marchantia polymorpha]BBM97272.1 hypothetical protein Mp_1g04360 [Marchantia polymorpha subsp. ruderalis]|eukprot:PTQ48535.1 hypothetical protein MARPO_0005s0171 [Marchantia polymorpha]